MYNLFLLSSGLSSYNSLLTYTSTSPSLLTSAIVTPEDHEPLSLIPEFIVLSSNLKSPRFLYITSETKFPPK